MTKSICNINLKDFNGPLDLLLHLIKNKNFDIMGISILNLINQYVNFFNSQSIIDIDPLSEYLVMATYLLEIKSKLLIPKEKIILEDDDYEKDQINDLKNQLLEYKKIKDLSYHFRARKEISDKLISKNYSNIKLEKAPMLSENIDIDILTKAFSKILHKMKSNEVVKMKIDNDLLMPEDIEPLIIKKLSRNSGINISFYNLVKYIGFTKQILVVVFLSILNLIKTGKVLISQKGDNIFVKLSNY